MSALHRLQTMIWAVGVAGAVGILLELATSRHWNDLIQIIPWITTGITLVAAALVRGGRHRVALVMLGLVLLASLFGMWEHIEANMSAGKISGRYERTWNDLGVGTRLWKAVSMDVGKSPPLVPGSMALTALLIALSTPAAVKAKDRVE